MAASYNLNATYFILNLPPKGWRQISARVFSTSEESHLGFLLAGTTAGSAKAAGSRQAGRRAGHGGLETLIPTSAAAFLPSFLVSPRFSLASNSPKEQFSEQEIEENK